MVIAVIDSGINSKVRNIKIVNKVCFCYGHNGQIERTTDTKDLNGHGTLICKLIQSINSENSFFIVKILNKENRASSELLIRALEYLLDYEIDIVLMSLATVDDRNLDKLKLCVRNLYNRNVVMISSVHNKYPISYPAVFDEVLGVCGMKFYSNEIYFDEKKNIEFIADSSFLYGDFNGKEMRILAGTSKAAAVVAARISQIPNFEQIQKCERNKTLHFYFGSSSFEQFMSEHNLSLRSEDNLHVRPYIGKDDRNLKVMELITRYNCDLSISDVKKKPLWHLIDSLDTLNQFLKEVFGFFNICSDEVVYSGNDLYSIDNLCNKLYGMETVKSI